MRKICHYIILLIAITALAACTSAVKNEKWELRTVDGQPERTVSIDTMQLRDPFVILDKNEKV